MARFNAWIAYQHLLISETLKDPATGQDVTFRRATGPEQPGQFFTIDPDTGEEIVIEHHEFATIFPDGLDEPNP